LAEPLPRSLGAPSCYLYLPLPEGPIVLAMADPSTVGQDLAVRLGQTRKTIWNVCRRYEHVGLGAVDDAPRAGRPRRFSPPDAGAIERLACCEPAGVGLHMTHGSRRSWALVVREQGIVPHIAHSTVSLILRDASSQPHRSRSWNGLFSRTSTGSLRNVTDRGRRAAAPLTVGFAPCAPGFSPGRRGPTPARGVLAVGVRRSRRDGTLGRLS
jgi:hypothetical protein